MRVALRSRSLAAVATLALAAAAVPAQQPTGTPTDPNFRMPDRYQPSHLASSANLPLWWDPDHATADGRPQFILFASDHSVGDYLGFNAAGSWIRHESGRIYVFNGATGTLRVGAERLEEVPSDLVVPAAGASQPYPRRVGGSVLRSPDGTYTLTYVLLEQGQPPRRLHFGPLAPTGGIGQWAWIGEPAQADPAALAAWREAPGAPGEPVGSAGAVTVDSAGNVQWQFGTRVIAALAFAHGEHGQLQRQADGSERLRFEFIEPGKAHRSLSLPVRHSTLVMNPQLERQMVLGPFPPRLDPKDAWVWIGSDPAAIEALVFNLEPNGWVRWNVVPPGAARVLLAGYTPADGLAPEPPGPGPGLPPGSGALPDPNLPRAGASSPAPPPPPSSTPIVWTYLGDATTPTVWNASETATPAYEELVYLGFNAQGSWLARPDGSAVFLWNATSGRIATIASNLSEVPTDLANPSDFMRRYLARPPLSRLAPPPAAEDDPDPLQVAGYTPGTPSHSEFAPLVGTRIQGTGAQVHGGVLRFTEAETGAKATLQVQRPAYVRAQHIDASLGDTGPWVWVSADAAQGLMINVMPDGSVTSTVLPGAAALGLIGADAAGSGSRP